MIILYCYNQQDDMFCLNRRFSTLDRAKSFVEEQRECGLLKCACYIKSEAGERILKRYEQIN